MDKANQDAWFKAFDEGNFEAGMHWTNGGATPYDIYENIMDGAILKPVGTGGVAGNYGRFNSPEATTALQEYANADRRGHPHHGAEHAAEDHGRADADDPDLGERRWSVQHQELDGWPTGRPVRAAAADPAERAGDRPEAQAGLTR